MNAAWKPVWLAIQQDFEGSEDVTTVDKETAQLGETVELEVDHSDVEDLIQSHNRGLTTEDLQELDNFIEHDSGKEEQNQDDTMPILKSKNFLLLGTVKRLILRHTAIEQTELFLCNFEDKGISYFSRLLMKRRRSAQ